MYLRRGKTSIIWLKSWTLDINTEEFTENMTAKKQKLKFYDIKARQSFETDQYETIEKDTPRGTLLLAVATSPLTGIKVHRILGRKK